MSKLSFVALSLQTTHLDPASVSKASYVKLVDGNITRQDDVPIIPPTSKKRPADEQAARALTPWNEALEKMRMMIGKLPIVSYYRDADKEIFQAASRQLGIEPPALRWLDCRELARKLLPDLPDVQLSSVLKTLDLYEDFADSSAVEQTAQIVLALAEQQGTETVEELWNELYDQPDDLLGLDSTFEGAAESGATSDDEELFDGPLAAEVLPFATAAGSSAPIEHRDETEPSASDNHSETVEAVTSDETAAHELLHDPTAQEEPGVEDADEALEGASTVMETQSVEESEPSTPAAEELPLFLQDPTRDELAATDAEVAHTDSRTAEGAEPSGAPIGPIPSVPDTGDRADPTDVSDDVVDVDVSLPVDPTPSHPSDEAAEEGHTIGDQPQEIGSETSIEHLDPTEDAPAASVADEPVAHDDLDDPVFLKESEPQQTDQQDLEPVRPATPATIRSVTPDLESPQPVSPREQVESVPVTEAASVHAGWAGPRVATPMSDQPQPPYASASAGQPTVQAIKVSELPRVEEPAARSSNTGRLFGFVGLFVFGVLSIIGIVLTVMAVMLFFTENSLMLETKIAGVILTVAITLLSLLMTNVSYRSFRRN